MDVTVALLVPLKTHGTNWVSASLAYDLEMIRPGRVGEPGEDLGPGAIRLETRSLGAPSPEFPAGS